MRSDLVEQENLRQQEMVTVQYAHGDAMTYPISSVELECKEEL